MTDTESARSFLGSDFEKYRQTLNNAIHSDEEYLNAINKYVLGSRGKEIRPILSLIAGLACGKLTEQNYCCAAATEMLHTATLMHDDVADYASMRRGILSVSAMFSAPAAVLTGDFWLARSLNLLVDRCDKQIVLNFSEAIRKMSEGELLQLDKADKLDTEEDDYFRIIYGKTAALFEASLKSAAMASGADSLCTDCITSYAEHVGLAFQIKDDIMDYTPGLDTGKLPGADLKERKITLPLIGAMKNAPEQSSAVIAKISTIEDIFSKETTPQEAQIMAEVSDFVARNKGIDYAAEKLSAQIGLAVDSLTPLPPSRAKEFLTGFAEYVGKRGR